MMSFIIYNVTKYYYGYEILKGKMDGTCRTYEEMRNSYKILVGKRQGKRTLKTHT